jgi:protease-4
MKKLIFMFSVLGAVFWAMDFHYFQRVAPVVLEKIKTNAPLENLPVANFSERKHHKGILNADEQGRPVMTYFAASRSSSAKPKEQKYVAVIPVHGPISKRGDWCSYGTKDYISWLNSANNDPNVDAIVLDFDSPGGTVDGTEDFAKAIKNSKKPVVGFVDGLSASAAYWATSQTSYVISNSAVSSWIGSIGTFITHVDTSKALDEKGLKVTLITADKSTEKTLGNPYEPLSEEAQKMYKQELNNINDHFISEVKSGRGDRLKTDDKIFTGKAFNGQTALEYGLIDAIGTLEDAVNKAVSLVDETKIEATSNSSTGGMQLAGFPFLATILGKKKDEEEEKKSEEDENAAKVEAELKRLHDENASLTTEKATLEKQLADAQAEQARLNASLAESDKKYADLHAEYVKLGGQASQGFTQVDADKDKLDEPKSEDFTYADAKYVETLASLNAEKQRLRELGIL